MSGGPIRTGRMDRTADRSSLRNANATISSRRTLSTRSSSCVSFDMSPSEPRSSSFQESSGTNTMDALTPCGVVMAREMSGI